MKKVTLLIALAALMVFAGCKKENETNGTTLKASIEQHKSNGSKTSLHPISDTEAEIHWTAGDKIIVNNGTASQTFTLTAGAGDKTGTFNYAGDYTFGASNVAVYPETATINGNTVSLTLPETQTFTAAGTFGNGANPMLGTFTDPENITFTSLCGVLGVSLTGDNVDITAIEIVGGPDDKLNGAFEADCTAANPALAATAGNAGTNKVMLSCNTTLTATPQDFYFVLPVGTLASGFRLNVYGDGADPIFSTNTNNDITIVLNQVNQMPEVPVTVFDPLTTPLTLEALTDGTIVVNNPKSGMQYSLNGGAKAPVTSDAINVSAGDKVAFYGNGTSINNYNGTMIAGGTAQVKAYGNIMSLIDETGYATLTTLPDQNNVFYGLFKNNANLTDASGLRLPATTLANSCYRQMFYGCSSLTSAPALPATTLAAACYRQMFYGCTSLTTAPTLPATTLTEYCYRQMFEGCSNLNSVTCLATDISASSCTTGWLSSVAATGTFTKASGVNWTLDSPSGIPTGWTVNEQ